MISRLKYYIMTIFSFEINNCVCTKFCLYHSMFFFLKSIAKIMQASGLKKECQNRESGLTFSGEKPKLSLGINSGKSLNLPVSSYLCY